MKKLYLILLIMLLGIGTSQAQGLTLNITGSVVNNNTGVPYNYVELQIYANGGVFYFDSTFTDTSGNFLFYPFINPSISQGVIIVQTLDCNGTFLTDTASFTSTNTSFNFLFNYCPGGIVCSSNFSYQSFGANTVGFYPSVTGIAPYTYNWDFGDGNTSTAAYPTNAYANAGTYTACLISTDATGCTDTSCQVITVNVTPPCNAQFSYFPSGANQYIFISDTTSNQNATFSWTFGNGNTSSQPFPSHTYNSPGLYLACLTVSDSIAGCVNVYCDTILVGQGGNNCVAGFSSFFPGGPGNAVQFMNTSTGSTPFIPLTYQWNFGDGTSSTQSSPLHTYSNPGTYNVCLTISDNQGCTDSICNVITITSGGGSNCNAYFTTVGTSPYTFSFYPDTVTNSPFTNYSWDFGDNSFGNGLYTSHTYNAPGLYLACLTIYDSLTNCTSTFCDSILVGQGGNNCVAGFYLSGQGSVVQFINTSNGSGPFIPLYYVWDFGDGNTSTQANPIHTYTTSGTYNVCLTITDNVGCTDSICSLVTISVGSGNCNAYFTSVGVSPSTYIFYPDTSLNSPIANYYWDFGDGSIPVSGMNPTHTYNTPGLYLACLTVIDSFNNCTATFCDTISVMGSGPACSANFSYGFSGSGAVQFVDLSTVSPNSVVNYFWDFGDGGSSNQQNPSHTYTANGSYTACLIIFEPATGCIDSACQTIFVQGAGNCDATFSSLNTGNQIYVFGATSPSPNYSYSWDFGDGTTGNGPSNVHTYSATGNYIVCLTVTDSTLGCTATYCDSVVVSTVPVICNADFSYILSGTGTYTFFNLSTSNNPNASLNYFWDFGDSTFSTLQNPTHTYANAGPYTACLTIFDSLTNCVSTYCQSIAGPSTGTYNISGPVFADSSLIYNGIVYLIVNDTTTGTLTAIDSTYIGQSFYTFFNVSPGTYLIKAALLPASPDYADYLPTYLGNDVFWYNAVSTVVSNSNIINPPIFMVPGINPGGPGFIGGLISQGANKNEGDPLHNVSVLILDMDGNAITHTTTDADGKYSFDNLAYGTYKIYVEIMGKYSDPWIVTISPDNQHHGSADFEVGDTHVTTSGTTGIEKFTFGEIMGIYPNPATDFVEVNVNFTMPSELSIEVLNVMGQSVIKQNPGTIIGNQRFRMDLQNLAEGTYMLKLQSGNQVITKRVVKYD